MSDESISRGTLARAALVRAGFGFALLCVLLFVPAGTIDYWQGWAYLAVLFAPMLLFFGYLIAYDPALLDRRLRAREPLREQRIIQFVGALCYFAAFIVPALDRRFGWSGVQKSIVIAADIVCLAGYALFIRVLRENTYASRVIEVTGNQRVISTGPYAVVRHPMYVAVLMMFLVTPVALGSWWGVLAMVPEIGVIVARIRHEESVLSRDLPGYVEYLERTRYRLIPGIW
jgi:protein-S-isoprenylcysteine O-methyltransferase Ste14